MKFLMMAAAALLAAPAIAQTPAPATLQVEIPDLPAATADPTCGGQPELAQRAFCVSTTQAGVGALVESYSAAFLLQGWQAGGGRDNLIVYLKPRPTEGCDGFQMLAFADEARDPAPGAPAYLAFAAIPGVIACANRPTLAPEPAAQ